MHNLSEIFQPMNLLFDTIYEYLYKEEKSDMFLCIMIRVYIGISNISI